MTQSGDFDYAPEVPSGLAGHGDRPVDSSVWSDFVVGSLNHLRDQSGQILASWMATSTSDQIGPSDNPPAQWHEAARVPLLLRVRPDGYTHGLIVHLRAWNAGTDGDTTSVQWRWYLVAGQEVEVDGIEPATYAARDTADATVGASPSEEWLSGDSGRSLRLSPREVAYSRQLGFRVAKNRASTTFGRVRPVVAHLIIGCEAQGTANIGASLRGYHIREFDTGSI